METWSVTTWLSIVAIMIGAYLLGSIPSAVWIGKKFYGIDIREHGSKNAGTTNTLRVLGRKAALPVFLIDWLKGLIAVRLTSLMNYNDAFIPESAQTEDWIMTLRIIATAFVVIGHIFPIFAGFKGGKGVATLLGAGTGIYLPVLLLSFGVWCVVFAIWHYVSLASMLAGCSYPIFVLIASYYTPHTSSVPFDNVPFIVFSWVVAVLLIWTHRNNITRLREGTESKIYLGKKKEEQNKANTNK